MIHLSCWRWLLFSSVLLLCAGGLSGCRRDKPAADAGATAATPLYLVGSDAHYAPFEEIDDKQQITGFDIELLNIVAQRGGFRVKFVHTPWDQLFVRLSDGRLSILASSLSITEARRQTMDFSEPYFLSRQMIAVARGEEDIRSFHDLQGKRVAVQAATTGDTLVQSLLGAERSPIMRFNSMADALVELEQGRVDAVVGDSGLVTYYVKTHRQSGIFAMQDTTRFPPEYYGFAVRKGDKKLLKQINDGLAAAKSDGSYDALMKKYFGNN